MAPKRYSPPPHPKICPGAVPLLDAPFSLLLPLATIEAALETAGKYR